MHYTPLTWVWKNTKSVIAVLLQFTLFHAAKPLLFVSWYFHLIFRKGQGWWWQIVLQEDFFSQAVLIDWCITFGKWGDGFCGDFQVQWKDVEFFAQESRLRLCQFYKSLKKDWHLCNQGFALVHVLWSRVIGHFVGGSTIEALCWRVPQPSIIKISSPFLPSEFHGCGVRT
jgi:hypothetical protein